MLLHPPSDIIHLFLIGNFLGCGIVPGGEAAEEYERLQQKKEYKKEYQHKKASFYFLWLSVLAFFRKLYMELGEMFYCEAIHRYPEYTKISPFIRSIFMKQSAYTGKGVGVALFDTGIYPHMDFGDRIYAFADFISYRKLPYDDNGHGTCVAGILGGSGAASMGKYKGMAPGCSLIGLKVLDRFGNGNKEDILAAFQWLMNHREEYRIRVVNISVGTTYRTRNDKDVLVRGVEQLWDQGLVVVAAAGNQGPEPGSITAPGCSKKVITVGSSDMLMGKEGISGRGPTFECVCKPDLVAPGRRIMSCAAGAGNTYGMKSGTSMSTPMISGAAALALEKDPMLTNVDIKMMLRDSADDLGLPKNQQGWGKFNCKKFLSL